jgi:hypothetical protein
VQAFFNCGPPTREWFGQVPPNEALKRNINVLKYQISLILFSLIIRLQLTPDFFQAEYWFIYVCSQMNYKGQVSIRLSRN